MRLSLWMTALRLYLGLSQHDPLPVLDERLELPFRVLVGPGHAPLGAALAKAEHALWAPAARAARRVHQLCLALEWTLRVGALMEVGVVLVGLQGHREAQWVRAQLLEAIE